jgi:hypothetical protein
MLSISLFETFFLYTDSFGNVGMCNNTKSDWEFIKITNLKPGLSESVCFYFIRDTVNHLYLSINESGRICTTKFTGKLNQQWYLERERMNIENLYNRKQLDTNLIGYCYPKKKKSETPTNWVVKLEKY